MTVLVALPVLLPLAAAGMSLALGRFADFQRIIGLVVLAAIIVDAGFLLYLTDRTGPVVLQLGGWAAPAGDRGRSRVFSRMGAVRRGAGRGRCGRGRRGGGGRGVAGGSGRLAEALADALEGGADQRVRVSA